MMKLPRQLRSLTALSVDNPLPRLRWASHRMQDRLGGLGIAALAVLAVVCVYYFAIQMPRAASLVQDKADLTRQLAALGSQPARAGQSHADRLKAMLDGDTSTQKLAVFETLHEYGIDARESTYRKDDEVKGKLERWSMNIAMTGRYSDLIHALHAFADQPLLRIDALTLDRPRIDDDMLNITLRISLLGADS
jgi:hypothetical protein